MLPYRERGSAFIHSAAVALCAPIPKNSGHLSRYATVSKLIEVSPGGSRGDYGPDIGMQQSAESVRAVPRPRRFDLAGSGAALPQHGGRALKFRRRLFDRPLHDPRLPDDSNRCGRKAGAKRTPAKSTEFHLPHLRGFSSRERVYRARAGGARRPHKFHACAAGYGVVLSALSQIAPLLRFQGAARLEFNRPSLSRAHLRADSLRRSTSCFANGLAPA